MSIDISTFRARYGLTQAQLAEIAAVSQPAVAQWETGTTAPSQQSLRLIQRWAERRDAVEAVWQAIGEGKE